MDKIKVILFGMTGFGNNALKVLTGKPFIEVAGVLTPYREANPFPYYECEKIHDLAISLKIPLYEGLVFKEKKTIDFIRALEPDLIVIAGFNQIINKDIISTARYGVINVHPSLLPKYRGATPTVWALMNGEKETGVTVHFIEDERIDSGKIIAQSRLEIAPTDVDGTLRFRLAALSENTLAEALKLILKNDKNKFALQDESAATYYPKRSLKDAAIDINKPFNDIFNRIRAMTPYPGAYLQYNGKKYIVNGATLLNAKTCKNISWIECEEPVVDTLEGIVKFQLLKVGMNPR